MTLRELMNELANLSDNGKNDDKEVINDIIDEPIEMVFANDDYIVIL